MRRILWLLYPNVSLGTAIMNVFASLLNAGLLVQAIYAGSDWRVVVSGITLLVCLWLPWYLNRRYLNHCQRMQELRWGVRRE